jgi:hypothetical protein
MIYPFNGGVGILPIIMLSIFTIILLPYFIFIKKLELIEPEIILFIFSFIVSLSYFCISALGFNLHAESGILPDMRLFSLIYAPIIIASLSIISRVYILNYKTIIRRFVIWFGITLTVFAIILMMVSNKGIMTTSHINFTANCIGLIIFAISTAVIIDVIRTNRVDGLETIIPIMVSLPLTWQIFTSIITAKLYSYPMYIPLMELIKKLVFG